MSYFLTQPSPAGSSIDTKYFRYDKSLGSIKQIVKSEVPTFEAVDDAQNLYRLPVENGWLLNFVRFGGRRERWAIFADDNKIYIDRGGEPLQVHHSEIFDVRVFGCLALIKMMGPLGPETIVTRFSWSRTWFIDGDTSAYECEPIADILYRLKKDGLYQWAERWTTGKVVSSKALTPL